MSAPGLGRASQSGQNETMKTKWLLVIVALVLADSGHAQDLEGLILDGEPVTSRSDISKAMVLVAVGGGTCSGVALTSTHVLTAGHCVDTNPSASSIRLFLGADKVTGPRVRSYKLHPNYGWEGDYVRADLAVLRTEGAMGGGVVPAPVTSTELVAGVRLIAAGYGYSDRARTRLRTLLQETFEFGVSAEYKPGVFSDGSRLLRLWGSDNLCSGDSGGATFRRTSTGLRTVGIHSMADCASKGYDVLVLDYASWIRATLQSF